MLVVGCTKVKELDTAIIRNYLYGVGFDEYQELSKVGFSVTQWNR
jgi:hypothetical protein